MMKKTGMTAIVALGILASCSKNQDVIDNGGPAVPPEDPNAPVEISLGAGQALDVTVQPQMASRGIGSVGEVGEGNSWNGETVYVYGINTTATADQVEINARQATAPKKGTEPPAAATPKGGLTWVNLDVETAQDKNHYYYEGQSIYSFYGCHLDDAKIGDEPSGTGNPGKIASYDAANGHTVKVTVDGTQDLMVAATDKTADINASSKKEDLTGKEDNLYSAWSARRDVTPTLVFKHLLSRVVFKAKTGNEEEIDPAIKISGIEVKSFSKGTVVIVPGNTANTEQTLTHDAAETEKVSFSLMQRGKAGDKLTALTETEISKTAAQIGESMMVFPDEEYEVTIRTKQNINGQDQTATITKVIKAADLTGDGVDKSGFKAGKSYTVNITVYGLEEIEINASLTAWENGGDVSIDPDEEPTPSVPEEPEEPQE